ncbi:MAG: hypothetical protein ABTA16_03410 [Niallia sp.]
MLEKINKFLEKKISARILAEKYKFIGRHVTIIGVSIIVSYIITLSLEDYWNKYYNFVKSAKEFNVIWILIGLYLVFIGISLMAYLGNADNLVNSKHFRIMALEMVPYLYTFFLIVALLSDPLSRENSEWISRNFMRVYIFITIGVYALITILLRLIVNTYNIFKDTILDGKERLTIIVTIFATIISAIALFK